MNNIEKVLNEYLEYKLRLKPAAGEDEVTWESEECMDCCNITYNLRINGFGPGITVTANELISYIIDNKLYFDSNNKIHYFKD